MSTAVGMEAWASNLLNERMGAELGLRKIGRNID